MPLPRSQQDTPTETVGSQIRGASYHRDATAPAVQTERNIVHKPKEKKAGSGTYCQCSDPA